MLNPALTKELIKGKENKYPTFLDCSFHSTVVISTCYSLPECQGTPCSKQVPCLKVSDSNVIQTHSHLVCK